MAYGGAFRVSTGDDQRFYQLKPSVAGLANGGDEVRLDHQQGGYWTTVSVDVDGDRKTDMQIMVGSAFNSGIYTLTMADFVHM